MCMQAVFKSPLETLLVNGELMEAIAIYSLAVVMKARKLFQWIDSLRDVL